MTEDPKQVTALAKQEAIETLGVLELLYYDSAEGREVASDALGEVKAMRKQLKAKKERFTKPLRDLLDEVRALFGPPEDMLAQAEDEIKEKLAAGLRRAEDAAALALAAAHEAGDAEAMAAVELVKPSGITVRQLPRVRYTDASLVPREFCEPSHSLVLDALQRGVAVPGAELYFEDSVTKR